MNRQITGRIAAYHFAPTPLSRENLLKENIAPGSLADTGKTDNDALYKDVDNIKADGK